MNHNDGAMGIYFLPPVESRSSVATYHHGGNRLNRNSPSLLDSYLHIVNLGREGSKNYPSTSLDISNPDPATIYLGGINNA